MRVKIHDRSGTVTKLGYESVEILLDNSSKTITVSLDDCCSPSGSLITANDGKKIFPWQTSVLAELRREGKIRDLKSRIEWTKANPHEDAAKLIKLYEMQMQKYLDRRA